MAEGNIKCPCMTIEEMRSGLRSHRVGAFFCPVVFRELTGVSTTDMRCERARICYGYREP